MNMEVQIDKHQTGHGYEYKGRHSITKDTTKKSDLMKESFPMQYNGNLTFQDSPLLSVAQFLDSWCISLVAQV